MPVTPTYPGVYIEELPSGVRTITGVATSITAFIGRALRGPVNEPIRIQSFADFERQFGGLWEESTLSYSVQQFFLNGGADALIVRLFNPAAEAVEGEEDSEEESDVDVAASARVSLSAGEETLVLEAITPGEEGTNLRATVNYESVTDGNHFNLSIFRVDGSNAEITDTRQDFSDITIAEVVAALTTSPVRVTAESAAALPSSRLDAVANEPFVLPPLPPLSGTGKAEIGLSAGSDTLVLEAANAGSWGNNLRAIVDDKTATEGSTSEFNLTVEYVEDGQVKAAEVFRNLEMSPNSKRYAGDVLRLESNLVRLQIDDNTPSTRPNASTLDEDGDPVPTKVTSRGDDGIDLVAGLYQGNQTEKRGLYALEKADLFNLMCLPPLTRDEDIDRAVWIEALAYCHKRRAMLIVDAPSSWDTTSNVTANAGLDTFIAGWSHRENAALYFPRIKMADVLKENRLANFAASGAIAGIMARTDVARGVWKAPAGIDATITGARELTVKLTDGENGQLNPLGVNCLRSFPVYGNVVWGARTLAGADRLASEWKYVPVRRLALFLEESLYRGTQWVVFEPNDEPLWAQIRLNLGAFMQNLFRQGAFQGSTPREAYFVKCDRETTTQNDINLGIVNIVVGFAPLKPAEFVIIKFQQIAGAIET